MCGRFAMDATTDQLIREYVADGGKPEDWWRDFHGSYSIAPTEPAVIVRDRGEGRILEYVRWDWQSPPHVPENQPVINATIEKLVRGYWARAFSAARCIVPMRGYYEWTGPKGAKVPHFLHGDDLLSAAGLTWSMTHKGEKVRCFVIITRDAKDASGEVHHRMPAFLAPETWEQWLTPEKITGQDKLDMYAMLEQTSTDVAATIRHHVVDRRISFVKTAAKDDASLIAPVS